MQSERRSVNALDSSPSGETLAQRVAAPGFEGGNPCLAASVPFRNPEIFRKAVSCWGSSPLGAAAPIFRLRMFSPYGEMPSKGRGFVAPGGEVYITQERELT